MAMGAVADHTHDSWSKWHESVARPGTQIRACLHGCCSVYEMRRTPPKLRHLFRKSDLWILGAAVMILLAVAWSYYNG